MPRSSQAPSRTENRPWRQADRDKRREIITDTALKLLHHKSLEVVTMRAVADKLGVGAMTLYTYIDGKHGLQREMVRRGFELLNQGCANCSASDGSKSWRSGARAYLQFAMDNPNLYRLMFDHFMAKDDKDLLHGGFQYLFDKVRDRLKTDHDQKEDIDRAARASAGRFWIALHGLATLAIAGRLVVLEGGLDHLLDDLIVHVAPDVGQ